MMLELYAGLTSNSLRLVNMRLRRVCALEITMGDGSENERGKGWERHTSYIGASPGPVNRELYWACRVPAPSARMLRGVASGGLRGADDPVTRTRTSPRSRRPSLTRPNLDPAVSHVLCSSSAVIE